MGKVETARNGVEALERTQERPFDVIITDINMPLLGGIDFYQQAVEINPGLRKRFIICSGELTTAQNAFIEEQGLHLLTKPCSVNEILRMVADVLAETTP
jgi:two-component system response regulator YesN